MKGITVTGVGRIVTTPEMTYLDNAANTAKTSLRIAVDVEPPQRDDQGNWKNDSNFYSLTAFGQRAEFLNEYFDKGDPIHFTGQLVLREHIRDDGTQTTYANITAHEVGFVPRPRGGGANPEPQDPNSETDPND